MAYHVQLSTTEQARRQNNAGILFFSALYWQAALESANFIDDTEIEVQRRDVTAAEAGFTHRHYLGKATVDFSWAWRRGVSWWGAQDEPAATPDAPTLRYRMQTWNLNFSAPVSASGFSGRYSAALRGQITGDTLYGTDFFAIGNRYTVRGFDGERTLAAERGAYIRNELAFPLGKSGQESYLGVDYGRVSGPSAATLAGESLAGGALGVRGNFDKHVQYDLSVGWPIKKPDNFFTEQPTYTAYLSYQF